MEIYLDNSATTRVYPQVQELTVNIMNEDYGNPSSRHRKGIEAERHVKAAKERIAKTLKISEKELVFTSCGTEADNLAIIGCAMANKRSGMHLITSSIEHPAVLNAMQFLEEQGFRVTYLSVDENARVRLTDLEAAICDDTILVSLMYVNNEVGSIQPIEEAAKLIHKKKPDILFHVDAVQAFGKFRIYPKKQGIDLMTVSGHKIHGPKGIGFLYIRDGIKIKPLLFGGGQQKGLRSGTENVAGIAGIGMATELIYKDFEKDTDRLYELKQYFIEGISKLEGAYINGLTGRDSAPHVVSVSFDHIRSEVLLNALSDRGIYVSSGSACASNHPAISGTLQGMGLKREHLDSTLRFSFSVFTTQEELDKTLEALGELLPMLTRFVRK